MEDEPTIIGPELFDMLGELALATNVQRCRAIVEATDAFFSGYWQTTTGRFCLRAGAIKGVRERKLDVIEYFCAERGVSPTTAPADENDLGSLFLASPRIVPLQEASQLGYEDICMYLLSLTDAQVDLGQCWGNGSNMCHFAASYGNTLFLRALVERDIDFDVRDHWELMPLYIAITKSRLPAVRFLLKQYEARGREQQAVLRKLMGQPSIDVREKHQHLLYVVICQDFTTVSDEDERAMVASLMQEGGVDMWTELHWNHTDFRKSTDGTRDAPVAEKHTLLPLHAAAADGNQALLNFILTECGMPVETRTRTPDMHYALLHLLTLSDRGETELLRIAKWLVGKGADATCRDIKAYSAAQIADARGKFRLRDYLDAQEAWQTARKTKEKEEKSEKAAAAAVSAARVCETEEAIAASLLELEAEEEAAVAKKKKDGKAGGGAKKKKEGKGSGGSKKKKK